MAVGKGSMARAAKTAGTKNKPVEKESVIPQETGKQTKTGRAEKAKTAKEKKKTVDNMEMKIVYQTSDGVLNRAAFPNEIFAIGDAMPVYYL